MFRRKRKPPDTPFDHGPDCKIVRADPNVHIEWSDLGNGSWRRECVCTFEAYTEPLVDDRVRLDPLDPKTAHHPGQCEYVSETDPAMLKVLLKVKDGAGGDYWWVECGACNTAWQVPYYRETSEARSRKATA